MSKVIKLFIEQVLFDFREEVDLGPDDKPKKTKKGKDILVEPSSEDHNAGEKKDEISVSANVSGYTLPLGAENRPLTGPGPSDHLNKRGSSSRRRSK